MASQATPSLESLLLSLSTGDSAPTTILQLLNPEWDKTAAPVSFMNEYQSNTTCLVLQLVEAKRAKTITKDQFNTLYKLLYDHSHAQEGGNCDIPNESRNLVMRTRLDPNNPDGWPYKKISAKKQSIWVPSPPIHLWFDIVVILYRRLGSPTLDQLKKTLKSTIGIGAVFLDDNFDRVVKHVADHPSPTAQEIAIGTIPPPYLVEDSSPPVPPVQPNSTANLSKTPSPVLRQRIQQLLAESARKDLENKHLNQTNDALSSSNRDLGAALEKSQTQGERKLDLLEKQSETQAVHARTHEKTADARLLEAQANLKKEENHQEALKRLQKAEIQPIPETSEDPNLYMSFQKLAARNKYQSDCHIDDKSDPDVDFQYPTEKKVAPDELHYRQRNLDELLAFMGTTVVRTKTKCSVFLLTAEDEHVAVHHHPHPNADCFYSSMFTAVGQTEYYNITARMVDAREYVVVVTAASPMEAESTIAAVWTILSRDEEVQDFGTEGPNSLVWENLPVTRNSIGNVVPCTMKLERFVVSHEQDAWLCEKKIKVTYDNCKILHRDGSFHIEHNAELTALPTVNEGPPDLVAPSVQGNGGGSPSQVLASNVEGSPKDPSYYHDPSNFSDFWSQNEAMQNIQGKWKCTACYSFNNPSDSKCTTCEMEQTKTETTETANDDTSPTVLPTKEEEPPAAQGGAVGPNGFLFSALAANTNLEDTAPQIQPPVERTVCDAEAPTKSGTALAAQGDEKTHDGGIVKGVGFVFRPTASPALKTSQGTADDWATTEAPKADSLALKDETSEGISFDGAPGKTASGKRSPSPSKPDKKYSTPVTKRKNNEANAEANANSIARTKRRRATAKYN